MPVILIAATAAAATSKIVQGQNAKKAANEAATLKELQAKEVQSRADYNAIQIRREGERLKGQQVTAFSASGVELSGSALAVLEDTQGQIRQDVYNMRRETAYEQEQLKKAAESDRAAGRRAALGGFIGAGASALSSVAGMSGGGGKAVGGGGGGGFSVNSTRMSRGSGGMGGL